MRRKLGYSGFTYVELIITVSIIALTLAFSGPSLERFAKQSKTKAAAREIYGRLQQARMTAIKENASVPAVFTNAGSGVMTISYATGGTQVLNLSAESHLRGAFISSNPLTITFGSNGTAYASRTVEVCHSDGDLKAYAIVVNNGGGIRIERRDQCT